MELCPPSVPTVNNNRTIYILIRLYQPFTPSPVQHTDYKARSVTERLSDGRLVDTVTIGCARTTTKKLVFGLLLREHSSYYYG